MCDQQRLRPACAYTQSDQSRCLWLEYSTDQTSFGVSKLKKEAAQARLSLHLSKCHIVENHMTRLIYMFMIFNCLPKSKINSLLYCDFLHIYFLTQSAKVIKAVLIAFIQHVCVGGISK